MCRFGTLTTSPARVRPTLRGACMQVISIATDAPDPALEKRAVLLDDSWFERCLKDFAQNVHPCKRS